MEELISRAIDSVIGGGVVGAIVAFLLREKVKKVDELEESLDELTQKHIELKDEKEKSLEIEFKDHIKNDHAAEILTEMKHINGTLVKVTDKLDKISEKVAAQEQHLENHDLYLDNLNKSIQNLRK